MSRLDALTVQAADYQGVAHLRIRELRAALDVIETNLHLGKKDFAITHLNGKASSLAEALTHYRAAYHAQQVEEVRIWQQAADPRREPA